MSTGSGSESSSLPLIIGNETLPELIYKAFVEAELTCTSPGILGFARPLHGVGITFHDLMTDLAAVACILSCLTCLVVICGHLFHWTNSNEQKQIVRIIGFIPVYSMVCFFSIWFYRAAEYIAPIAQYYEGFAVVALFLLYVTYITPDESSRMQWYQNQERRGVRGKKVKHNRGSLRWFKVGWIMVLQVIPFRIMTLIAFEVLYGVTCPLSAGRQLGSIAVTVVQGMSTLVAVIGVVRFERRMSTNLKNHRPLFKLFAFKMSVGLELIQSVLFTVLAKERVFFPTLYISYNDFYIGVPQFLLINEMFLFSIIFIWAYEYAPYRVQVKQGATTKSVGAALVDILNPSDIFRAVLFMFTAFVSHSNMSFDGMDDMEHKTAMMDTTHDGHHSQGSEEIEMGLGLDTRYSNANKIEDRV